MVSQALEARMLERWPHEWDEGARKALRQSVAFAFPLESRALFVRPVETLVAALVEEFDEIKRTTKRVSSPAVAAKKWRAKVLELDEELDARDRSLGRSPPSGGAAGPEKAPIEPLDPEDRSPRVQVLHATGRCGGSKNSCAICLDDEFLYGKRGAATA